MYLPHHFEIADLNEIDTFIAANPFGALVNVVEALPVATHLPLQWIARDEERYVHGHMARANTQWRSLSSEQDVLVMFTGPHAYISPRWYTPGNHVPTWSYTAVHVYGTPRLVTESIELHAMLKELVDRYEAGTGVDQPYRMENMPQEYIAKLMQGVVAFEIKVNRIEAKYKLSQNRQLQDAHQVMSTLVQQPDDISHAVAQMMHRIYDQDK